MDDEDMDLLEAIADARGLIKAADIAAEVERVEEDVRSRLLSLCRDGYVSGPILVKWENDEGWSEAGYGLTSKGREALDGAGDAG